uniref:Uncharacterized protein n=1 Tax=Anguilla anguilla TaxID=7936 RepID=A0A0E9S5R0_ANGAN
MVLLSFQFPLGPAFYIFFYQRNRNTDLVLLISSSTKALSQMLPN